MERRGRIREVPSGAEPARVPPHDLEAEKAVIGAMLVSEAAVAAVAEKLTPKGFYSEVHRIIYGAMMRLYSRGDPIDQLTLTNELRTMGEFDKVGGRAYVFQIVESVPTAANAARYADIVRGKAFLRSMIDAGSRILDEAFQEPENVNEVLDAAEQLIFNITNENLSTQLDPVAELGPAVLDIIQRLYESEGPVTGVEAGFEDLDRLTTGFHKSDLVILAARPAMGKTALALNVIQHVAMVNDLPVAIFSLEMSKEQLVQRLISQETRIRAQDLRNGNVRAEDWPKLVKAVAKLSRAPIWIDDTAGTTLMEIKAKIRRLASRLAGQGDSLALVVIDYLQLMMGQDNRSENRQQEIAEISRGLKVLARDLDVPVLAIAQLSRAVEQRHDKRPLLSDLRDSGCLTGDTRIFLPDEGIYRNLNELVGCSGFRVLALNTATWKLEPRVVSNSFTTGCKEVFELVTRLGRRIRATANHKFLTASGWRRLDQFETGDRLALPRQLPGPALASMSDEELALLGHMIGVGRGLPRQPIHYTTNDLGLAERVADLANRDLLPREIWRSVVVPAMEAAGVTVRQMQGDMGETYCGSSLYSRSMSRERATRVASAVMPPELARLAESDVYWDEIIAIEPAGEEEVYDLTVEGLHNFVAGDIIVHNSIEQDADMVMFLYRDEYYNPESDDKGIAEVIVGKHRNGPTGKVQLAWMEQYTKFASLARRS